MAFIDGSVVTVALPAIQADLATSVAGTQWVANAYMLMLGALILVGGSAGDRFGRRRVRRSTSAAKLSHHRRLGIFDEALTELRKRESAYCKALLQPAAAAGPAAQGEVKAFNDQLDIVKPMFESVFRKIPVGAVFDPRC